ncbi:MAG: hypothetical protein K6L73_07285 [Cellvibrionaceae bacterium]
MKKTLIISLCALATFTGCASNPDKKVGNLQLPAWVLTPSVEDGLAETACVNFTGYINVDRDEAAALARNGLTQQIEIRAANMTKTYASKTNANGGANVGTTFETNARQIAEATLKGSKIVKTDIFEIEQRKQLCAMVTVEPRELDDIAEQLITRSGAKLPNDDKAVLKEQFKAKQGQEELEKNTNL